MSEFQSSSGDLERMNFLAGHWRSEIDDAVLEEIWLAPSGGVAQAMVRLVKGGVVHTIELIVVREEERGVVMRYNHFRSDYSTWEADGPITLTLTTAQENQIIFSNLEEKPRDALEMGYRLHSPTAMSSWVIVLSEDGATERIQFDFERR